MTLNANRLFDDIDNTLLKEQVIPSTLYQQRLNTFSDRIKYRFQLPDVIAFQEIENISILKDLSHNLGKSTTVNYQPVLLQGNDTSGINVGYLVKDHLRLKRVEPLFSTKSLAHSDLPLYSRPPLLIEICDKHCITLVNVHLRSMNGLRSPGKGSRVALKRRFQAEHLARWINAEQKKNPSRLLVVLGDFNALSPSDNIADTLGTILGDPKPSGTKFPSRDFIDRDLVRADLSVSSKDRVTYRYKGHKQQLDYVLLSQNLSLFKHSARFFPLDYELSDHAPIEVTIDFK